tara:strand:- start:2015 stop:2446 length:432 start_codon:yes stop_codon:yes gene_type:complete
VRKINYVFCQYCKNKAQFSFIHDRPVWICHACDAWIGVHVNTDKPLAELANRELRDLKKKAHFYFGILWHEKAKKDGCTQDKAKESAYKWLAGKLKVDHGKCRIEYFDTEQCKLTINLCKPHVDKILAKKKLFLAVDNTPKLK